MMKTKNVLWAFFVGALTGVIFAPKSGKGTRQWIMQQGSHLNAEGKRFMDRGNAQLRYRTGSVEGYAHKIKDRFKPEEKLLKADDDTIAQRVRSALGEAPLTWKIPHPNINSEKGVVTIRGPVKNRNEKDSVEKITKKVAGVKKVINKTKLVA